MGTSAAVTFGGGPTWIIGIVVLALSLTHDRIERLLEMLAIVIADMIGHPLKRDPSDRRPAARAARRIAPAIRQDPARDSRARFPRANRRTPAIAAHPASRSPRRDRNRSPPNRADA